MANQMIWFFFRFSGRINRIAYFWGVMLMLVVMGFLIYRLFSGAPAGSHVASSLIFNLGLLMLNWAQAALGAKRFHDIDKPGILALLLFVPMVNLVLLVALGLIPGTQGANKYGAETNAPAAKPGD